MSKWPREIHISLLKRSFYGQLAMICTFMAVTLMPVSIDVAIMQTTSLVTAIMANLIQNDPLSLKEIVLIIIGAFACIVLLDPQYFVKDAENIAEL